MERENAIHDLAYLIERRLGEAEGQPYWDAYRRVIYSDRPWISDDELDGLLVQGRKLLAKKRREA